MRQLFFRLDIESKTLYKRKKYGKLDFIKIKISIHQSTCLGTSLAVQWLRRHTPNAGGTGSIPGQGTKIPNASWCGQKKKKTTYLRNKYKSHRLRENNKKV